MSAGSRRHRDGNRPHPRQALAAMDEGLEAVPVRTTATAGVVAMVGAGRRSGCGSRRTARVSLRTRTWASMTAPTSGRRGLRKVSRCAARSACRARCCRRGPRSRWAATVIPDGIRFLGHHPPGTAPTRERALVAAASPEGGTRWLSGGGGSWRRGVRARCPAGAGRR